MTEQLSRRDRVRAATLAEIKATARRVLVEQGTDGMSLRAIAREMGLTAPALYRYFPSREDLLADLIADLYDELSDTLEAARDREAADDLDGRLLAACRAFRTWALDRPREFGLLFGSPIHGRPGPTEPEADEGRVDEAGQRFGAVFGALVAQVYLSRPFPVPADDDIDPDLRGQLSSWGGMFPVPMPLGLLQMFLSCWIRIYGSVCMEVFGHLKFALADAEPLYEAQLRDLCEMFDAPEAYRPPLHHVAP